MDRSSFAKLGMAAVGVAAAGAAVIGIAAPSLAGPVVSQVPYGVYTIAGNGQSPQNPVPQHVPATQSGLAWSAGLAYDHAGNMYIAETFGCQVRKVDTQRKITTYTDFSTFSANNNCVSGYLAIDANDQVYASMPWAGLVVRLGGDGSVTKIAGGGTSTASSTGALNKKLGQPGGIAFGPNGTLYVADSTNQQIYAVSGGQLTTVAGTGTSGYNGDNIPAASAQLSEPFGLTAETDGSLLVGEDSGCRIRHFTPGATITTIAGTGVCGFSGDTGAATSAKISDPIGIAVDKWGNLFFSDQRNERVREITTAGNIYTYVGNGTAGYNGEGHTPTTTELDWPNGVAIDPSSGYVTFVDASNVRVRQVRPQSPIVIGHGLPFHIGGN
jgi:sugar lactone lactonase YvrE